MQNRPVLRHGVLDPGGRPRIVAPDLEMVQPLSSELFTVDEERGGHGDCTDPDEDDEGGGTAFRHVSLHRKYDSEETIARDQGQCQNTRNQRQHCQRQTQKTPINVVSVINSQLVSSPFLHVD